MKTVKTIKEMRQAIIAKYESIPNMEISAGIRIKSIGNKYVHILNTWGGTSVVKQDIREFYRDRVQPYCN